MLLNIFPGGDSFLHKIVQKDQTDDIAQILQKSQPSKVKSKDIKIFIPIALNLQKISPLHLSNQKLDYQTIQLFLKYLESEGPGLHSKAIKSLIPILISKELPCMVSYLDSRFQQTRILKSIQRIKLSSDEDIIGSESLWIRKNQFIENLASPKSIERRITCSYIDLPEIYHQFDEEFENLFESLTSTQQLEIFDSKALQYIIEVNYSLIQKYTLIKLLIPHVIFQLIQLIYYFYLYDLYDKKINPDLDYLTNDRVLAIRIIFLILIFLFSTYFFITELPQFYKKRLSYFKEIWNYIDLIVPIGFYILIIFDIIGTEKITAESSIRAIVSFCMWIKFLYFLRIFTNTGVLIRLILVVIYDMRHFLLVLFFSIMAFSDSLLSLSLANEDDSQFVTSYIDSALYTYKIVVGDTDTSNFGNICVVFVWIIFLSCSIFTAIILLNLLIAILSDSFARIMSYSQKATFQEQASLIFENSYLIPKSTKQKYCDQNKYILIVKSIGSIETDEDEDKQIEQLTDKVDELKELMQNVMKNATKSSDEIKEQNKKLESLFQQLLSQQKELEKKPEQKEEEKKD